MLHGAVHTEEKRTSYGIKCARMCLENDKRSTVRRASRAAAIPSLVITITNKYSMCILYAYVSCVREARA